MEFNRVQVTREERPKLPGFQYKLMNELMLEKAQIHGRDLLEDILRLISAYYTFGYGNIDRVIEEWTGSDDYKRNLIAMRDIYGLRNSPSTSQFRQSLPSLSKITEGFPQVSLVLAGMIGAQLDQSRLWSHIRDSDLGATVDLHFKMLFFPVLILTRCSLKAQVGLIVFNLCNTRSILKKRDKRTRTTISAFKKSCSSSTYLMEQNLASQECKRKFTQFVESLTLDANTMFQVWQKVIGSNRVPICAVTKVTHFHEKVLKAQPLNLHKWTELLGEGNSRK